MGDRTPTIVGIGLSEYPKTPHLDALAHHGLAIRRALEDSGVQKSDIDGLLCFGSYGIDDAVTMAEILGITYNYLDGTFAGGTVFEFYVQHAAAAIEHGDCDTVLITYGSDLLSKQGRNLGTQLYTSGNRQGGPLQFEMPYGSPLVSGYALAARRHMHQYGTTSAQLARVAVDARANAALNPLAMYRDPLTVEDVLASRMISDPLHMLDCCIISDGGGAVLMTTAERARDLQQTPIYVRGAATAQTHWNISAMPDFTVTAAARSGPDGLREGGHHGIGRRHVDALRQLHHHRAPALGGPRVLQEGRGRAVPRGEPPDLRRGPPDQHRRRRAVVVPSWHEGHLPPHRIGPSASGTGRCGPSARRRDRRGVRIGRSAFLHGHRRPRQGEVMKADTPVEGRILPAPNSSTQPFWDAAGRGELIVQWCEQCQEAQFHPGPLCRTCGSEPGWKVTSGRGAVYTYTIVHQSRTPPFDKLVPYIVAMVELDEGPRMMTNIIGCPVDDIEVGMRVEVAFAAEVEGIALPFWQPEASS